MTLFHKYSDHIKAFPLNGSITDELLLERNKGLSVYYAPFDVINKEAKVVICGLTPGRYQAERALHEAGRLLSEGATAAAALKYGKETASFSGPLRANLIALLDAVGLHELLGLSTCEELFGARRDLVHFTSALRYPVFLNDQNYSGTPKAIATPFLQSIVDRYLADECRQLSPDTLYIPLGKDAAEILHYLANNGVIDDKNILSGLPHPSGANAERISVFVGKKAPSSCSSKTNPDALLKSKQELIGKIQAVKSPQQPSSTETATEQPKDEPMGTPAPVADRQSDNYRSSGGDFDTKRAERMLREQLALIGETKKLAGFQTRSGKNIALQREREQTVMVWIEHKPGEDPRTVGATVKNTKSPGMPYAKNQSRSSNLNDKNAPRLKIGRSAWYLEIESESVLKELLNWYN